MSIILTKKSVLIYFSLLTVSTSCREKNVLSPDLRISNLHFPYAEQAVSRHRIQARFSDQYLSVVPVKHLTCMQETQLLTKHSEPQQSATMDIMHSFSRTNPIVNIDMNFISKYIKILLDPTVCFCMIFPAFSHLVLVALAIRSLVVSQCPKITPVKLFQLSLLSVSDNLEFLSYGHFSLAQHMLHTRPQSPGMHSCLHQCYSSFCLLRV